MKILEGISFNGNLYSRLMTIVATFSTESMDNIQLTDTKTFSGEASIRYTMQTSLEDCKECK